jgi:hypothetical protein
MNLVKLVVRWLEDRKSFSLILFPFKMVVHGNCTNYSYKCYSVGSDNNSILMMDSIKDPQNSAGTEL